MLETTHTTNHIHSKLWYHGSPWPCTKGDICIYAYFALRLRLGHYVCLSDLMFFHPSHFLFCDTHYMAGNKRKHDWAGEVYGVSQSQPLGCLHVTSLLEAHYPSDVSKVDFNPHFLGFRKKASIPPSNLSQLNSQSLLLLNFFILLCLVLLKY